MDNLLGVVLQVLAENGETRTVTLLKLTKQSLEKYRVLEPIVLEYDTNVTKELKFYLRVKQNTKTKIDFGNGDVTVLVHPSTYCEIDYTYKEGKIFRIKVYNMESDGVIEKISTSGFSGIFAEFSGSDAVTEIISIGRVGLTSLSYLFCESSFNGVMGPNWDTRNITDMKAMFSFARNFNQPFGKNWDTSSVIYMDDLLLGAINFNQPFGFTLGTWDTSKVTDLGRMFCEATKFNQPFKGNLDVSNVISMVSMFKSAHSFNQTFGENWDTRSLRYVQYMFEEAINFNKPFGFTMGKWDTSKIVNTVSMFSFALSFNQPFDFSTGRLNFSSVLNAKEMFYHTTSFNQPFDAVFPKNADISNLFLLSGKDPKFLSIQTSTK